MLRKYVNTLEDNYEYYYKALSKLKCMNPACGHQGLHVLSWVSPTIIWYKAQTLKFACIQCMATGILYVGLTHISDLYMSISNSHCKIYFKPREVEIILLKEDINYYYRPDYFKNKSDWETLIKSYFNPKLLNFR